MKKRTVLFNASFTYLVVILLFVLIRILALVVDIKISDDLLDAILTLIVQIGLMFFLPIFLFSFLSKQKIKKTFFDLGFSKINFSSIIICILIGLLCYFLNVVVASFFGSIINLFGYETAPSFSYISEGGYSILNFIQSVVLIAILPAICEETVHRGLLLKGFSSLGIKSAVILSSILFGLLHLNINQFFYATVLGFIIAISVVISKSIFPAIIIHFMNNFLSVYFSFASQNKWFGNNIYKFLSNFLYSDNLFSFFVTICFVLLLILLGIIFLFYLLLKETRIKKVRNMLSDIAKINQEFNTGDIAPKNQNFMNLHNLNKLMGQYNIKSLNSMIFTDLEIRSKKPSSLEIIFLTSCFVVGGLITAFTFVWGMI